MSEILTDLVMTGRVETELLRENIDNLETRVLALESQLSKTIDQLETTVILLDRLTTEVDKVPTRG